jgi:hypothetical protein
MDRCITFLCLLTNIPGSIRDAFYKVLFFSFIFLRNFILILIFFLQTNPIKKRKVEEIMDLQCLT